MKLNTPSRPSGEVYQYRQEKMHIHVKLSLSKFCRLLIVGTIAFIIFATIIIYDTTPSNQEVLPCLNSQAEEPSAIPLRHKCEKEILAAIVSLHKIEYILESSARYLFYLCLIYLATFLIRWVSQGDNKKP